MRTALLPLAILWSASALAAPLPSGVLWQGLPDEIPVDFLEREGFLPLEEVPEATAREIRKPKNFALAPIATNLVFDDEVIDVKVRAPQLEVFSESMFAMIPAGTKIGVAKDAAGRETWRYPLGASAVHLIRLKDKDARIFELRLARRVSEERWAFGSYSPVEGRPEVLVLNKYEGWPDMKFPVDVSEGPRQGKKVQVKLTRVKLDTCQACHFSNSLSDYQYERFKPDGKIDYWASVKVTGPCGFVPLNPNVRMEWAPLYADHHGGQWPFDEPPPAAFFQQPQSAPQAQQAPNPAQQAPRDPSSVRKKDKNKKPRGR